MYVYITRPFLELKSMVNWRSIKDKIETNSELFRQHYATSTKLYVSKRHRDRLSEIIPKRKATDLIKIKFEQNKIITVFSSSIPIKVVDYLGALDSFFYSLRSCIDSFLWKIKLIFKLRLTRLYTKKRSIWKLMNDEYKDKEITKLLTDLKDETWFKYLSDMRNYLAHRLLSELAVNPKDLKLYLPANPNTDYYLLEREFEVIPCLDNLLKKTKEFLEEGYDLLIDEFVLFDFKEFEFLHHVLSYR